ncbi:MAG: hypothetical protein MJZ16_10300 [Bacteroidales bacterium]|nr:hypothetical protein [Bacteroidales bacterium]
MKDPREPGYDPFNPGPEGNREIAELTEKEKKKVERFWKHALKRLTNIILICLLIVFPFSCSMHKRPVSIDSFMNDNSDLLPEEWNGWTISRHQDHGYLWLEVTFEGVAYPRVYYSRTRTGELVKYSYNGVPVQETVAELTTSSLWSESFPFVSAEDLLARFRWFDRNDLEVIYGHNDTVSIRSHNYQLNRCYLANSLIWTDLISW